jgi:hypothetical protein
MMKNYYKGPGDDDDDETVEGTEETTAEEATGAGRLVD